MAVSSAAAAYHEYAAAGYRPLPLKLALVEDSRGERKKRPKFPGGTWEAALEADADRVAKHYPDVAILCDTVTVLDFDLRDGEDPDGPERRMRATVAAYRLDGAMIERTGDGWHVFTRTPPAPEGTHYVVNNLGPPHLIDEVRVCTEPGNKGALVFVAPSYHPLAGRRYERVTPLVPVAELPDCPRELLKTSDQTDTTPRRSLKERILAESDTRHGRNGNGAFKGDFRTLDVVALFQSAGLYLKPLGNGKHGVRCPWEAEHTGGSDGTDTAIFEAGGASDVPGFKCLHAHCAHRTMADVREYFGPERVDACCARRFEPNVIGAPVSPTTRAPDPETLEPMTIEQTIAAFQDWLHLPDPTPLLAVLGAVAANRLPGDPVWLGLVAPPSSAKTEILNALSMLPNVYHAATLTPAALLSGTPNKEKAADSRGGLLRQVGDFGILVCKDFGSVLSMRPDSRAEVLAALREIYDGSWTRHVGTDGGKTLTWAGKLGLVFGVTPALDSHHAVIGAMGERFVLCRVPAAGKEQAERALEHSGERTGQMRQELAATVAALFAGARTEPRQLDSIEREELVHLASLAVRLRSTVERDRQTREIEAVYGAEGPARLVLTLERLLAGLDVLGVDRVQAFGVVHRVAMDSTPPIRRRAFEWLEQHPGPQETAAVATALGLPTTTVRRALEDLAAYQLVSREKQGSGKADMWVATP